MGRVGKRGGGSGGILERGGGSGGILRGIAVDVAIVGRQGGGSRSNVVAIDVAIDVGIIGCC